MKLFSIPVLLPETDVLTFLSFTREGRVYSTSLFGDPLSMEKKEDGSWSCLRGEAAQETIDAIASAIEAFEHPE